MNPTDFSKRLSDFLIKYLPGERGVSSNTISSYKYTFLLLITFVQKKKNFNIKALTIKCITKEFVVEFLDWLQKKGIIAIQLEMRGLQPSMLSIVIYSIKPLRIFMNAKESCLSRIRRLKQKF